MLQDTAVPFDVSFRKAAPKAGDRVLCYTGPNVLVLSEDPLALPDAAGFADRPLKYLFTAGKTRYFLAPDPEEGETPAGHPVALRAMRTLRPRDAAFAAVTGQHLRYWYRTNRFCGRCGGPMQDSEAERALCCGRCGLTVYPTIAPAVIIAVTRGERILVSHYADRPYKGQALLAGYCEISETLEDTVRREVFEETGLHVEEITYEASQPWGFDHNLLMGFYCKAPAGDIRVDTRELKDAYWLARGEIGELSDDASLTNTLLARFRDRRDPFSAGTELKVRHARPDELPQLMAIYKRARAFMAAHGNPRQWGATCWPPEELIRKDIERGKCYVCVSADGVEGVFYYDYGMDIEPGYRDITEGSWQNGCCYGVVHRMASLGRRPGVGSRILGWALEQAGRVRIDTHPDNTVMQGLLCKLGFERRGVIHVVEDNDPRYAFEITGQGV